MQNQKIENYTYASIIGNISILYCESEIIEIQLNSKFKYNEQPTGKIYEIACKIEEYLAGKRTIFDISYDVTGTTFERQILRYVATIPYGKTLSYKEVAKNCGFPNAYRAVGSVLRKNKLPLIIPCHRVIKSDGSIGDFNGGKAIKAKLLSLEKNVNIY